MRQRGGHSGMSAALHVGSRRRVGRGPNRQVTGPYRRWYMQQGHLAPRADKIGFAFGGLEQRIDCLYKQVLYLAGLRHEGDMLASLDYSDYLQIVRQARVEPSDNHTASQSSNNLRGRMRLCHVAITTNTA